MTFDALTLADLLEPDGEDDVLSYLLDQLAVENFPVTSWDPMSSGTALTKIEARALANLMSLIAQATAGGYLGRAKRDWLTLYAKSQYDEDRFLAQFATGIVRLMCAAGAGPYTIAPGGSWITEPGGKRFNSQNATSQTLASGGTLDLAFRAELAGTAYNLPLGTTLALVTALPGVTATLLETPADSGTWLTSPGTDVEGDDALATRCSAKWGTLGTGSPASAYVYWSLSADGRVDRVYVDDQNPDGPGSIRVYIAGPSGALASTVVAAVDAFIQPKIPEGALLTVLSASAHTITVSGTVYCRAAYLAQAQAQVAAALEDLADATPIGGTVYLSAVYEAIMSPLAAASGDATAIQAVRNVALTAPTTDTTLATGTVAAIINTLVWVSI